MYQQVPKVQDFYDNNFSCAIINSIAEAKTSNQTKTINNNFKIYPNPSTNNIYVELGEQTVKSVSLYSLLGQKLQEQLNPTGTIEFQRQQLPNGVYLIQIQTNQGIVSQKVQLTSY